MFQKQLARPRLPGVSAGANEHAKANPGMISRGSPGTATLLNLGPTLFEQKADINITHVPFNGDAPSVQGMLSNSIDIYASSSTSLMPRIQSGNFRVLGVANDERIAQLPDVPTFKEQGYDLEMPLRYFLSVPAGTPEDVIDRLNKVVNEVLSDSEFIAKTRAVGFEARGSTPEEMARIMRDKFKLWAPVLEGLNLPKLDK